MGMSARTRRTPLIGRATARRGLGLFVPVLLVAGLMVAAAGPAFATLPITPDDTWGADGRVLTVLRVGDVIYLGGEFGSLVPDNGTGVVRNHLAAIDANTGLPTSFDPNLNNKVFDLALSPDGTRLYAAGAFTKVGTTKRKRIAAFDVASGALLAWRPAAWPSGTVRAVAPMGSTVYIGGGFKKLGVIRTRLAALDADSGAILPWAPSADGLVRTLLARPDRIYAGGNFVNVSGVAGRSLAAIDPDTGAVIGGVYHPHYPVLDLDVSSTRLLASGAGAGGRALAVNLASGAYLWDKRTDGNAQAVGVQGGFAYFGGHFFKYDGRSVFQVVRVDPATGVQDRTWLPDVNGFLGVFAISGTGSHVYLGGDFDHVSAVKQLHFASLTDGAQTSADVAVSMTASPDPVDVGSTLTFSAQVSNGGPDVATDVELSDPLPVGVTFAGASAGCSYAGGANTVTCSLGSLGSGATVPVTISVSPGSAGTVQNEVTVTANEADPDGGNNTASASAEAAAVPGADLHLTVAAPEPVDVGTNFDYTATILNEGSDPADDVTLTDHLPDAVTLVTAASSQGSCSGTSTVSCSLGSIAFGDSATVTITVTAPGTSQTVTNNASVSGSVLDPDPSDDAVTTYTTVRVPSADLTPPAVTGATMFDDDHNGKVDRVVVTFDESLSACPAPCALGWNLTSIPSGGTLQSAQISGTEATLTIAEGSDDPDTSVGGFRISLVAPNGIQDDAGNHATFDPLAPADGAGPVPVAFRHQHNNKASLGCDAFPNTSKVAGPCDELTAEWSEALDPSSIPATTTVTLADPAGPGNDTVTIASFFATPFDGGGDGYVTADGESASWAASKVVFNGPLGSDYLTIRIWGGCAGSGCSALGVGPSISIVYVPSPDIKDAAGNSATGSFTKTQVTTLF